MVAVLVWWLSVGSGRPGLAFQTPEAGETHLLALLILLALTLPSGLLWVGLLNALAYMLHAIGFLADAPDVIFILVAWLGFVAVGYFQWFSLVPWLWRKWQARRARCATPNV
jgi:hypothetical protein